MTVDISVAGWTEVATFTKVRNQKLRDTFRVFVNPLGWVKGHSDKSGKDNYFNTIDELLDKIEALQKIRYRLATGELPTEVVNRYA